MVGTQEERIFASTPCLLPSVLLTPPLSPTQALLISGHTEVVAHFKGHLRTARLDDGDSPDEANSIKGIYNPSQREMQGRIGRMFLFLDALEMDGESHGKDLGWENVHRELKKLTSGFHALASRMPPDHKIRPGYGNKTIMVIPPWGCGTFGGDFHVKLLLIWMCASAYGDHIRELRLVVRRDWWESSIPAWRSLIGRLEGSSLERAWSGFTHLMERYSEDRNSPIQWHIISPER
jgi:hypothetical protein